MTRLKKQSDEELVDLLKSGSEKAFNELYDRYWRKLLAQALYDIGNEADAEEAVQDIFIKLWNNRESLLLRHQLSTYLYRAVKNQALNVIQKRYSKFHSLPDSDLSQVSLAGPAADAAIIEKELMVALEYAIRTLPEKCASIFRMSRDGAKSNREIALELGISEKTVEAHITRALKHINNSISDTLLMFTVMLILINVNKNY